MTPAEILTAINLVVGATQMPAGSVRPEEIRTLHDLGGEIVRCYHPSATYNGTQIIERPWMRGLEWNADHSAVLYVHYLGRFTRQNYTMTIAVMSRGASLMALPLADTNLIPWAKDCQLKNWLSVSTRLQN